MLAIDLVCSQSFISGSFLLSLSLPLSSSSAAGCLSFFFFFLKRSCWVLLFLFGFRSSLAVGCQSFFFFFEEERLGFCSFFLALDLLQLMGV